MIQTDKKFRSQRQFFWETDGHRINLYIYAYLNVSVRIDKFKDYVAASLEAIAAELRQEAAEDRGRYLLQQAKMEKTPTPLTPEEEKEQAREEKKVEKEATRDTE